MFLAKSFSWLLLEIITFFTFRKIYAIFFLNDVLVYFVLAATSAVRGILSNILSNNEFIFGAGTNSLKFEAIRKFIKDKSTNIESKDQLLQIIDLQRLKNLIYRDMVKKIKKLI